MTGQNLQQLLDASGDTVELLRNQQTGPNVYPGVPGEYSNWRSEQIAWQKTAVLFNQSYHMVDLEVSGPDAFAMLNYLGVNSFKGFVPDRAKQFVPVTPDGYVIGDVILFYLEENKFNLVGRAPTIEWVEYQASTGKWNVTVYYGQKSDVNQPFEVAAVVVDENVHKRLNDWADKSKATGEYPSMRFPSVLKHCESPTLVVKKTSH